jgi:vacuolar-type H+-ATPase subunit I/STV1
MNMLKRYQGCIVFAVLSGKWLSAKLGIGWGSAIGVALLFASVIFGLMNDIRKGQSVIELLLQMIFILCVCTTLTFLAIATLPSLAALHGKSVAWIEVTTGSGAVLCAVFLFVPPFRRMWSKQTIKKHVVSSK